MKVETCHTKGKPVSTHQGLVNHDDTDGGDDVEHPRRSIWHNLVPRLASWRRTHAPTSTREPSPIQVSEHLSTESPSPARESIRVWQWHQQQKTETPAFFIRPPNLVSLRYRYRRSRNPETAIDQRGGGASTAEESTSG